jgi:hypothetical protein
VAGAQETGGDLLVVRRFRRFRGPAQPLRHLAGSWSGKHPSTLGLPARAPATCTLGEAIQRGMLLIDEVNRGGACWSTTRLGAG